MVETNSRPLSMKSMLTHCAPAGKGENSHHALPRRDVWLQSEYRHRAKSTHDARCRIEPIIPREAAGCHGPCPGAGALPHRQIGLGAGAPCRVFPGQTIRQIEGGGIRRDRHPCISASERPCPWPSQAVHSAGKPAPSDFAHHGHMIALHLAAQGGAQPRAEGQHLLAGPGLRHQFFGGHDKPVPRAGGDQVFLAPRAR